MITIKLTPNLPFVSSVEVPGTVTGSGRHAVRALGGEASLSRVLGHGVASDWRSSTSPSPPATHYHRSGSASSVANQQQQGEKAFLRCNVDDKFSKFLVSSTSRQSDVLLRVRRNRRTGQLLSAAPIGIVIEKVSFESMADFYCIPPDKTRSAKFNIDRELSENISEPLFVPPPVFTRIVTPFHYKFEDNPFTQYISKNTEGETKTVTTSRRIGKLATITSTPAQTSVQGGKTSSIFSTAEDESLETAAAVAFEKEGEVATLIPKNNPHHVRASASRSVGSSHAFDNLLVRYDDSLNAVCRFETPQVPREPLASALASYVEPELLSVFQQLFQQRPIWLRIVLDHHLSKSITPWKKRFAQGRTCFLFLGGPWRGALCRLGYDPREDPASRRYQTIDFRDPYYRSVSWRTNVSVFNENSHPSPASVIPSTLIPSLSDFKCKPPAFSASEVSFIPKPLRAASPTVTETSSSTLTTTSAVSDDAPKDSPWVADDMPPSPVSPSLDELLFCCPPSRPSQLYQLCDIDDYGVQRLVEEAPLVPCSKTSGWYSKEDLTKIRDLMFMNVKRMREERAREEDSNQHQQQCAYNEGLIETTG